MERLKSLSCFFPSFNEEANLPRLLDEVVATLPRFAEQWEAIIVDDGSTDRSAEIVAEFSVRHPEVKLVRHEENRGYGEALRTGFRSCTGDAIFFTDADLQFRLEDLERIVPAFTGADVVVGYRLKRRDPWHRLVVAAVYHVVLRLLFRLDVHDVDCAFKLFRRPVVDAFASELRSRSAFISPELVIRSQRAGFRLVEVGVPHYPRVAGAAGGASVKVILRTIREIVALRRDLRSR